MELSEYQNPNVDVLVVSINKFIRDFGFFTSGILPSPNVIMYEIMKTMPTSIVFTDVDYELTADIMSQIYLKYTKEEWLNGMKNPGATPDPEPGNGNGTDIPAPTGKISTTTLLIGAALLILLLMPKSTTEA